MTTDDNYLTECPLCGLRIDSVRTPGIIDPWGDDPPLMVQPCTCVVPAEVFRHGRQWARVAGENDTIGVSSGVEIRLEYSGDGLGPLAGDFDEIVLYDSVRPSAEEVVRYKLDEIHRGTGMEVTDT